MATFQKGILGGFSGKVGPVIGASWRGKDIMRSLPKKTSRMATERQQAQRLKFALSIQFLSPIRSLLAKYFGQPANDKSRENMATSYHIIEAIVGTFPDYEIDFQKVVLTKGELIGVEEAEVTPAADAKLNISWTNNSGQGQAEADDRMLVIVFNETRGLWEYRQSAVRSDGTFTFDLPDNWSGNAVHCWLSFTSDDRKLCAVSQYMDLVVLL